MFEANVFISNSKLLLAMLKWPKDFVRNGREELLFSIPNGFSIRRQDNIEVRILGGTSNMLYIPGVRDSEMKSIPVYECYFASPERLTQWIEGYKLGYKALNGVDATIIDLSQPLPIFSLEKYMELK